MIEDREDLTVWGAAVAVVLFVVACRILGIW